MIEPGEALANLALPVRTVLGELRDQLAAGDTVILEAEPGAGKSTLVPLALLGESWLASERILMLEPRRVAARATAQRMAELLGEEPGGRVGYRMRGATRVSATTRIEVITEGVLTRMLRADPALEGVGLVIFDEFHERSLDADLGLALTWQGRELFREGDRRLKLLLMSATLDGVGLSAFLDDAPVVSCEGRRFPVEVIYASSRPTRRELVSAVVELVNRALREGEGSVLVFLPGQAEILSVAASLQLGSTDFLAPLYGGLSLAEQRRAIAPPPDGRRKVVLATNIAETSLTIEGVTAVVDAGLVREPSFHAGSGLTRLVTGPISRASSEQRSGRAGRLGPGRCYRLWTAEQQARLVSRATPEILQSDLSSLALQLLAWGVDDPAELRWLDPPPAAAWLQGLELLRSLGIAEQPGEGRWVLTRHGQSLVDLPLPVRLAHLLRCSGRAGLEETGSLLAVLLSERDPLPGGCDLESKLRGIAGEVDLPMRTAAYRKHASKEARRYRALLRDGSAVQSPALDEQDALAYLLASAWPERIARRVATGEFQLAMGRRVSLDADEPLSRAEWLIVPECGGAGGNRVFRAAQFNPDLLDGPLRHLVQNTQRVVWDRREERLRAESRDRVGELVIAARPLSPVPEELRVAAIAGELRSRGLGLLGWTDELRQWQARVQLLRGLGSSTAGHWPDVSEAGLQERLEQWLAPFLCGVTTLADLAALDLKSALLGLLDWQHAQELERLAPSHWQVPAGPRRRIDYCQVQPVLPVKLQEMFGCETTPAIADGQVELLVQLLSPAGRPLQSTRDLAGFWRSGYAEVRKEMRGRYPKHPWPEDPLSASPTSGTRKR